MNNNTILITGGYGNTGSKIARLLMKYTSAEIIIGGRDLKKSKQLASQLNQEFKCVRAKGISVDVANLHSLIDAFMHCKLVIVASSTSEYTMNLVNASIKSGVDYIDLQISKKKLRTLKSMEGDIAKGNRYVITDGGFHPGLPAAIVRYAAQYFDELEIANVYSFINLNWSKYEFSESTVAEMIKEIRSFDMSVYKNSKWRRLKFIGKSGYRKVYFGTSMGVQLVTAMLLEEMKALPVLYPSLKETGFYVSGFNRITDYFVLPAVSIATRFFPKLEKLSGTLLKRSLQKFSKPPFMTILKLEAKGIKDGHQKEYSLQMMHNDGYMFTAIPVAAFVRQYLNGLTKPAGLHFFAHIVDPDILMKDMFDMGIEVLAAGEPLFRMESYA